VDGDLRSFRVALVAGELVNPEAGGVDALAVIEQEGWGAMQLPAADYPDEVAAPLLDQVAEQTEEFARHGYTLALVGSLALVVQVARVGVIWLLARALSLDVPDSVVLLTGPVVFASLALPVSLNGIGVREGVFVYFLHGYAARPQAVALGLAFYAVGTITALGGAAVLIVRFVRHGMGAVRPRTRIEGSEPEPDLTGGAPPIPQPGDGAGAPAERSTRA